jgi:hypothetical protein
MGRHARAWNLGGVFDTSLSGRVRCSAQGQTAEQPFSAFGTVRVRQRGCTFRFVPPRGTGQGLLRGTIRGRHITLNGPAAPPSIPGFDIDRHVRLSRPRAHLARWGAETTVLVYRTSHTRQGSTARRSPR